MANPLGQAKDLYKMQREAKSMQNKLREVSIKGESKDGRIVITLNAAQEFEDLFIDDSLLDPSQLDTINTGMKQAYKDFQKKLQKEMMKDFDMDSFKNMFS